MSEAKFTKGPWQWANGHLSTACILGPNDEFIAGEVFEGSVESNANAHLIAAAPELYESVQELLLLMPPEYEESPMVAFAKAALAKARGEAV